MTKTLVVNYFFIKNGEKDKASYVTLKEAESEILKSLDKYSIMKGSMPSGGFRAADIRLVLEKLMPNLDSFLNYM